MIDRQSTQQVKAAIAKLYDQRNGLMKDLMQNLASARSLGDYRALNDRTKENLTFEIVQLIANWDGAKVIDPDVQTEGGIAELLSAIVEVEDSISALELDLPAD